MKYEFNHPKSAKKKPVTTKSNEKTSRKQASSSIFTAPTPSNRRKLKINLSKTPNNKDDISYESDKVEEIEEVKLNIF